MSRSPRQSHCVLNAQARLAGRPNTPAPAALPRRLWSGPSGSAVARTKPTHPDEPQTRTGTVTSRRDLPAPTALQVSATAFILRETKMIRHQLRMCLQVTVSALALMSVAADAAPAHAGTYVFGDSAAEQGNLYTLPGQARPGTPYYVKDGFSRDSNGPMWVEYIAPGIKPSQGAAKGDTNVNFAYSGATSGIENIAAPFETGLTRQVDAYVARLAAGSPKPGARDLFVIEAGVNDFIRDLGTQDLRETSKSVVSNVNSAVARLAATGAKRILVEEVPDYIHAPLFNDIVPPADRAALEKQLSQLGDAHRAAQVGALAKLNTQLGGDVNIVNMPINKLFQHILGNGQACYDDETGVLCSTDPAVQNGYLFFDRLHLSSRGQQLQAQYYGALLEQLDGRANLVPGAAVRDGLARAGEIVAAERDERQSVWLNRSGAKPGFRAIAEGGYGRSRSDASATSLKARGERQAYRLGFGYTDASDWTFRAIATRFEDDTRHSLGRHDLDGWAATVSGERRFGPWRLGASLSQLWGDLAGTRQIPVPLMSTRYDAEFRGRSADFEVGLVLGEEEALSLLPSAWMRYSRAKLTGLEESGETGLEMSFASQAFETVYAGAGLTAAYRAWPGVRSRVSASYERRVSGGYGTMTGELIGNSADPISTRFSATRKDRLVIEPGVTMDLDNGLKIDLSARHRFGEHDTAAVARMSFAF